ncbi:MAG: hypothetical protein ACI8UO_004686 [Verrucomicrobiales bacterium]|jgi:hypothetical protein
MNFKTLSFLFAIGFLFASTSVVSAQDFKPFQGRKLDIDFKPAPRVDFTKLPKMATVQGRITEVSFPDRRIRIVTSDGGDFFVMLPSRVTIAGDANIHNDVRAFRRHFRNNATIRVVENRRVRNNLIEARDVLAPVR